MRKKGGRCLSGGLSRLGTRPAGEEKFQRIKQAVLESRVLSFTYYSTCGQTTNRRIEPMKLRFRSSAW